MKIFLHSKKKVIIISQALEAIQWRSLKIRFCDKIDPFNFVYLVISVVDHRVYQTKFQQKKVVMI